MNIDNLVNNSLQTPTLQKTSEEKTPGAFGKLWDTVKELNANQLEADSKIQNVLLGKSDDTSGALIALEKAEIQMQFAANVRDKFTQGYQQIINMQL